MAGNPPTDINAISPRSLSLSNDHLKALSTATLLLADIIMLTVAFLVSYEAREILPFFSASARTARAIAIPAHHRPACRDCGDHVLFFAAVPPQARL